MSQSCIMPGNKCMWWCSCAAGMQSGVPVSQQSRVTCLLQAVCRICWPPPAPQDGSPQPLPRQPERPYVVESKYAQQDLCLLVHMCPWILAGLWHPAWGGASDSSHIRCGHPAGHWSTQLVRLPGLLSSVGHTGMVHRWVWVPCCVMGAAAVLCEAQTPALLKNKKEFPFSATQPAGSFGISGLQATGVWAATEVQHPPST